MFIFHYLGTKKAVLIRMSKFSADKFNSETWNVRHIIAFLQNLQLIVCIKIF